MQLMPPPMAGGITIEEPYNQLRGHKNLFQLSLFTFEQGLIALLKSTQDIGVMGIIQ